MISVKNSEITGSGRIGFEHFIHTYGIILNEKSSFVNISHGHSNDVNNDYRFNISVVNNPEMDDFEDMIYFGPKILHSILNLEDNSKIINSMPFISIGINSIDVNYDIFSFVGKCLTGDLEHFWKKIPKPKKEELGKIPIIDVYERILFLVLLQVFEEKRLPFISKSFWPGKRYALCLTHDVDEIKKTYQWGTRPLIYLKNLQLNLLKGQIQSFWHKLHGEEPYWTFDEIMKIEDKINARSSFYFLKEKGKVKFFAPSTWKLLGRKYDFNDPRVKIIMKKLLAGGWDIGLHGSYESYEHLEMLRKEKNELEMSIGQTISGTRQHHLNINIPRTWEYHEKIGMKYDTTLGFKDQMGFRGGTCLPFHPYSDEIRLHLLEIPLAIMDTPLFKRSNEVLSRGFEEMDKAASKFNGVLTLLWHHTVFNENEFPGWGNAYTKIIDICNQKKAWVTSAKEISDWWMLREKTNFKSYYNKRSLRIIPYQKESSPFLNIYIPRTITINEISNAEVIENNENLLMIRANNLKNNDCVEIKFKESDYGNRIESH